MDFAKLSAERYSLRKYSDRPVEAEKLALILESGRNAPTAHNNQPQRIFVLQSPEALEKADACMGSHFHPPVILAVAYDPAVSWHRENDGKDHGEIDAAIAATQMMLQAADLGLGATWVQLRGRGYADGRTAQGIIKELLNVPDGVEALAVIAVGHPDETHRPYSDDRLPWAQVHDEKF